MGFKPFSGCSNNAANRFLPGPEGRYGRGAPPQSEHQAEETAEAEPPTADPDLATDTASTPEEDQAE